MLKFLKSLFNGSRNKFGMTLGESGVIQLIPLLLILAGIIAGVYLVQKSGYQIFKPKAGGASIQFIDHSQSSTSCVTTKDGKQVTTCPTIQFKLFSPLENQSYNIIPGLVSTAYAHDEGLDEQESRSCTTNGIGMHVVRSSKPGTGFVEFCWPGAQECRIYEFEDGHQWARCVRTTFPPCDGEIDWVRGRDICKPKAQPGGGSPAPACIPSCDEGLAAALCTSQRFPDSCDNPSACRGTRNCTSVEPTAAPQETPGPEEATPVPTRVPVPTTRPLVVATPQPTPEQTSPQPPQGGGTSTCITGPAGAVTAAQAQCVINLRSDILPFYQKNNWCIEGKDYPGIINNWMGINNQADKDQVKGCFGGGGTTTRVTKRYRFAETPDKFNDRQYGWKTYTAGGVTETITFADTTPRSKFIYAQFEDDQGNIINASPYPAQIELVAEPTPAIGCPLDNFRNFDIPTLKQKCKNSELAKLPVSALADFSNQDLLEIAKSVDGESGPYKFLSQFDNNRLSSFDLAVLKKLPEDRIERLPESLKNLIKGTTTAPSEEASCASIAISGAAIYYATVKFEGKPQTVKIWLASNSEIDKSASDVQSWTPVKTISNPTSGSFYELTTQGFSKGSHAVLMSLHGSYGQMLDGNPGGVVNSNCATTLDIL